MILSFYKQVFSSIDDNDPFYKRRFIMASVTTRINQIQQPHGGYINPKQLTKTSLPSEENLNDISLENVHASLVGLAVDYLTRFMLTKDVLKSFEISMHGANVIGKDKKCAELLYNIRGLDERSIECAIKVVGFDVCFRAGPDRYKPVEEINPNAQTIQNVKIMVKRSIAFFREYGPIVLDGFTFEGAYTSLITSGDGDFTTKDTLWDFKVSSSGPTNKHTLQLLIYYLMGKHSVHKEFDSITKIGIFNPRLNEIYVYEVNNVHADVIKEIEKEVIGYKEQTKKSAQSPIDLSGDSLSGESAFLTKYVKRNKAKAEACLIQFGPKALNLDENRIKKTISEADQGSEDYLRELVLMFLELSRCDDILGWDYVVSYRLFLEAIVNSEKLYQINKEKGAFCLAWSYCNPIAILKLNGDEDDDAARQKIKRKIKYLTVAWEEYDYVFAGEELAFWLLAPFIDQYNPKKGIEILKKLEQADEKLLSPVFYTTYGNQYLMGQYVPRNIPKAKMLYQKAYEKGDKGALKEMENMMKRYHISTTSTSSTSSRNSTGKTTSTKQSQNGCYVATCVYGSYDCPQVWILRRYRDFYLKNHWWGRLFIRIYYFISPKIIRLFGKNNIFKKFWRKQLDKKVDKLKVKGYLSTNYYD